MPQDGGRLKARIKLKIHAGAKKTAVTGMLGDAWKLSVAAPPVDGRANDAVLRFLAGLLSRPVSAVRIAAGFTSRTKVVEINGVTQDALDRAILESNEPRPHAGSSTPRRT